MLEFPPYATEAAILYVACLMAKPLVSLAVVTVIAIPLTYSIADGIGLGFLTYVVSKVLAGRGSECPAGVFVIAAVFAVKFTWL